MIVFLGCFRIFQKRHILPKYIYYISYEAVSSGREHAQFSRWFVFVGSIDRVPHKVLIQDVCANLFLFHFVGSYPFPGVVSVSPSPRRFSWRMERLFTGSPALVFFRLLPLFFFDVSLLIWLGDLRTLLLAQRPPRRLLHLPVLCVPGSKSNLFYFHRSHRNLSHVLCFTCRNFTWRLNGFLYVLNVGLCTHCVQQVINYVDVCNPKNFLTKDNPSNPNNLIAGLGIGNTQTSTECKTCQATEIL